MINWKPTLASPNIERNLKQAIPDVQRFALDVPLEITDVELSELFEHPVIDDDIRNLVDLRQREVQAQRMPSLQALKIMDEIGIQIRTLSQKRAR